MLDEERLDLGEALEEGGASDTENIEKADTGADVTAPEATIPKESEEEAEEVDYAALAESDLATLRALFPSLRGKRSIAELDNPLRYAALRDLGLTPKEAYLATSEPIRRTDMQSHLCGTIPREAGASVSAMSAREMDAARELFSGLSDREIRKLYNKVTK